MLPSDPCTSLRRTSTHTHRCIHMVRPCIRVALVDECVFDQAEWTRPQRRDCLRLFLFILLLVVCSVCNPMARYILEPIPSRGILQSFSHIAHDLDLSAQYDPNDGASSRDMVLSCITSTPYLIPSFPWPTRPTIFANVTIHCHVYDEIIRLHPSGLGMQRSDRAMAS